MEVCDDLRSEMKNLLLEKLRRWSPTEAALSSYPFLSDAKGFVENFMSCVEVHQEGTTVELSFNKEALEAFSFPDTLPDAIEFGNQVLPSFSFIRPSLAGVEGKAEKLMKERSANALLN